MLESSSSILCVKLHTDLIIEALKKKAGGATELAGVKKSGIGSLHYSPPQKSYTLSWENFLKV